MRSLIPMMFYCSVLYSSVAVEPLQDIPYDDISSDYQVSLRHFFQDIYHTYLSKKEQNEQIQSLNRLQKWAKDQEDSLESLLSAYREMKKTKDHGVTSFEDFMLVLSYHHHDIFKSFLKKEIIKTYYALDVFRVPFLKIPLTLVDQCALHFLLNFIYQNHFLHKIQTFINLLSLTQAQKLVTKLLNFLENRDKNVNIRDLVAVF